MSDWQCKHCKWNAPDESLHSCDDRVLEFRIEALEQGLTAMRELFADADIDPVSGGYVVDKGKADALLEKDDVHV